MTESTNKQQDRPAGRQRLELVDEPLKCVWSGFPSHERSCRSRIPASVVVRAWHREMQLKGAREGFFHFSWRSGVWLGYGLADGGVRGVYCPTHSAERAERSSIPHSGHTAGPVAGRQVAHAD
jgi:hypothetical protein